MAPSAQAEQSRGQGFETACRVRDRKYLSSFPRMTRRTPACARVPDAGWRLPGNGSSHAIAEEVRVLDLQLFQQRGGVIRHLLETQRPVDVVGMPMPLQLDRNHLMSLRQRREKGAPPF